MNEWGEREGPGIPRSLTVPPSARGLYCRSRRCPPSSRSYRPVLALGQLARRRRCAMGVGGKRGGKGGICASTWIPLSPGSLRRAPFILLPRSLSRFPEGRAPDASAERPRGRARNQIKSDRAGIGEGTFGPARFLLKGAHPIDLISCHSPCSQCTPQPPGLLYRRVHGPRRPARGRPHHAVAWRRHSRLLPGVLPLSETSLTRGSTSSPASPRSRLARQRGATTPVRRWRLPCVPPPRRRPRKRH